MKVCKKCGGLHITLEEIQDTIVTTKPSFLITEPIKSNELIDNIVKQAINESLKPIGIDRLE